MYTIKIHGYDGFVVYDGNRKVISIKFNTQLNRFKMIEYAQMFATMSDPQFKMEGIGGVHDYDDIIEIFAEMGDKIVEEDIDRFFYSIEKAAVRPYMINLKVTDGRFTSIAQLPEADIDKLITILNVHKREVGLQ